MNECRNSTIQLGWVLLRREISRFGFCEEGDRKRQCICLWEWCDCDLPEVLRCGAGTHCLISRSKARDFQRWSHHLASRVLADAARLMQYIHLASQRASGFSEVYSHACQSFMHSDAWGRRPSTSDRVERPIAEEVIHDVVIRGSYGVHTHGVASSKYYWVGSRLLSLETSKTRSHQSLA